MTTDEPEWVWVPDPDWRCLPADTGKLCRMCGCRRPAVAELLRGRKGGNNWWAYCPRHLYGRLVKNGVVKCCIHPDAAKWWLETLAQRQTP